MALKFPLYYGTEVFDRYEPWNHGTVMRVTKSTVHVKFSVSGSKTIHSANSRGIVIFDHAHANEFLRLCDR